MQTVFEEIVAGDVKFIDLGVKQAWARMLTAEAAQKVSALYATRSTTGGSPSC
jgi:copper(I)-binding protein